MKISTISKVYANALFDIAKTADSITLYKDQLQEVFETIESCSDLKIVMANSSISISVKLDILESVFNSKIEQKLLNFLKILVEKERFAELENIIHAYKDLVNNLSNIKIVEVFSAIPLNFENKSNILFKLEHKLGCEIHPIWIVDESLIAGLRIKIDDCTIDTSVRAKLESLSKNIVR